MLGTKGYEGGEFYENQGNTIRVKRIGCNPGSWFVVRGSWFVKRAPVTSAGFLSPPPWPSPIKGEGIDFSPPSRGRESIFLPRGEREKMVRGTWFVGRGSLGPPAGAHHVLFQYFVNPCLPPATCSTEIRVRRTRRPRSRSPTRAQDIATTHQAIASIKCPTGLEAGFTLISMS